VLKIYKYKLPDINGQTKEYEVKHNSIVLIGANGSGKSKLGAWMEMNDINVHRIGAQRSLTFGEYIQQKSFEQACNLLLYGNEKEQTSKNGRWQWDGEKYNYTSSLLNDYENILSALFAMDNNQNKQFVKVCKEKEQFGQPYPKVPSTVIDALQTIWARIFPQRQLEFDDAKVTAVFSTNTNKTKYKARDMSDGERVALYLTAQCLCIPQNRTVIIDEPEIHLHRSIMNRLWTEIEATRQDCFFVYITHDTQFAANHRQSNKIWVKSFDGQSWDLEDINISDLPEQLLLDIMGNRKPVLFVEGTTESYDTKLYSEIFRNYYIMPCGSCSVVISQTKAMKNNPQLHHLQCYGIIDRDYRNDYEIEEYKKDNIYTLKVAEVENLFLVEELLDVVNKIMAFSDNSRIEKIKKYIIKDRYEKQINRQICEAVVAELKYKLSVADISKKNEEDAKQSLDDIYNDISYDSIKSEQETLFNNAKDYKEILSVFNCKSLSSSTGHIFDLDNKSYCDFIIRQLKGDKAKDIINAIDPYLPREIPK